MDFKNFIAEFSVVYSNLEDYNQVLTKARCRIFYKGINRNGTYISEEFGEKLVSTLPYTPVKGIYDTFNDDYTDHGEERNEGRIYGIVPENPNFAWEKHLDEDGVEREYACTDVLLFTAIYEEAKNITEKPQSMELYVPSIKGEFKFINGQKVFEFTEGCFLGLQVLGDDVEPCFEGAAFYTFVDSLKKTIFKLEQYSLNNKEGGQQMDRINFKLSDSQKHEALWSLLNTNYCEDGGWTVDYSICDIYDDYAIAFSYETGSFERVYYTKDDETDSVSLGERKKCFIVDVTEAEKNALSALQALNNGTYENINENFVVSSEVEEKISDYEQKIEEKDNALSTLNTEKEELQDKYTVAEETINSQNEELESLRNYKMGVENSEKQQVLDKYAEKLSEEVIDAYTNKIGEYTIGDLEKDLAYELVKSSPSIFSIEQQPHLIPKDEPKTGLDAILENYRK